MDLTVSSSVAEEEFTVDMPRLKDPKKVLLSKSSFNFVNMIHRGAGRCLTSFIRIDYSKTFIAALHNTYVKDSLVSNTHKH